MPIYEYVAVDPAQGCSLCRAGFEVVHPPGKGPSTKCPDCGQPVRKLLSAARVKVKGGDPQGAQVMDQIRGYERNGMWSHAAELADTHAADTKNSGLQERAMDNYKKAGMDPD